MSFRLLCLMVIRVFGWLVLLGRSEASKDAEACAASDGGYPTSPADR